MYKKFFGFKEKPFQLAPNPEYFFLSKKNEKVLAHIIFAIAHGKESVRVTGEQGIGKTTFCKAYISNLDSSIKAAYISAPLLDGRQFLKAVNDEFWIDSTPDNTKEDLIKKFKAFLIKKKSAEQKVLLIIDEAQGLTREALEQLELLCNLNSHQETLLQVILAGQPELDDMLSSSQAGQLGELITQKYFLEPLTFIETTDYIKHCISRASHKTGPPFDKASCRAIHDYSKGIPKLINIVCEMALQKAFSRNSAKITGAITREAIKTLTQEKPDTPHRKPQKVPGLAILSAILLSLVLVLFYFATGQFMKTAVIIESPGSKRVQEASSPIVPPMNKPAIPEKTLAIDQSEPGEKNSEPSNSAAYTTETAEKPLAINQSEPDEKNSENNDVYSVHVGTFSSASQANTLLNNLKSLDFPSFGYSRLNKKGNIVHVVVAGKYQSYDLAKEASLTLSKKGHNNFIAMAKDSLKIPVGSEPINAVADTPEIPENPLAVNPTEPGEKSSENGGVYSVHVGTFTMASQASMTINKLKSQGFPSFMYPKTGKNGNSVYVVVAGKYQSYDLAKEASLSLNKKGYDNFIAKAKNSLNEGPER